MPPFKMKPPRYELRIREDGRAEAVVGGYVRFAAFDLEKVRAWFDAHKAVERAVQSP